MKMADETGKTAQPASSPIIGSDKVEGTAVYRPNGQKIGRIETVMLNKRSGAVDFVVMSFGGLFQGKQQFPLPWRILTYSEKLHGYELDLTDEQLEKASRYTSGKDLDWDETDIETKVKGWSDAVLGSRFERAKGDVAKIFAHPDDILRATDLTDPQRIVLLQHWETDLRLLMVASDENMPSTTPGNTAELLQAVRAALMELGVGDEERGKGTTKTG